jgi:hypothetical protein
VELGAPTTAALHPSHTPKRKKDKEKVFLLFSSTSSSSCYIRRKNIFEFQFIQKKLVAASCKRGKKRNPPTVFFPPVCRPTPTYKRENIFFLSLIGLFLAFK